MTHPRSSVIPDELLRQVEDQSYLETCDWGMCSRQTEGFAQSDSDASGGWLTICEPCSRGEFPAINDEPYPVDRFICLNEIEDALGWDH